MHLNFPHFFRLRNQHWNTRLLRRNWQLGHEQPPSRIVQLRRITTSSPSARNQVTYIVLPNSLQSLSRICLYSKYGCCTLLSTWICRGFHFVPSAFSPALVNRIGAFRVIVFFLFKKKKKKKTWERKLLLLLSAFEIAQRRILVQLCHIRQERVHCQDQHLQLHSTIQWLDPEVPTLPEIVLALAEVPVRPSICQLFLKIVCQATWGWVLGPVPGVHLHLFLRARLSELTLPCQRLKEGYWLVRTKVTKQHRRVFLMYCIITRWWDF